MTPIANPLICDTTSGLCALPDSGSSNTPTNPPQSKVLRVVYFTDPICSACWGIEPQLRRMKLEYGQSVEVEYRMGGLLPDWSYNSGGISKPADVAHHWDEVSQYYDMPIDGDLWLEDPLASSYPPSIAFKAAQIQSQEKALLFMRAIREMVFLRKKNIARWENLEVAAKLVGLDAAKLKKDMEGEGKQLFEADLKLSRKYGVRGFPTLIFTNAAGEQVPISGVRPYRMMEEAIKKLAPETSKSTFDPDWKALFSRFSSLTAREFAELSGIERKKAEQILQELAQLKQLKCFKTKNGNIWSK